MGKWNLDMPSPKGIDSGVEPRFSYSVFLLKYQPK
jgi:hypothetical protein